MRYGGGERPPPGQAFAMELPGMCNVPQGGATQMPQMKQLEAELAIIFRRLELEQLQGFMIQNSLL